MKAMTLIFGLVLAAFVTPAASEECAVGAYRLQGGDVVDIAPSEGEMLRWRRPDGTTGALMRGTSGAWTSSLGWTGRSDGVRVTFDCKHGAIVFGGVHGRRIAFDVSETRFAVEGAMLSGRLIMPHGKEAAPIVVLVHGAERISARETYALQRLLPAAGIGAFVYDKRGTGDSSGRYTHDYLILAVDAVAAMREARRIAGDRAGRIGYQAGSQGGWVAPLAARITLVDFVVVSPGGATRSSPPLRARADRSMWPFFHAPSTACTNLNWPPMARDFQHGSPPPILQ
ncbi:MAG: hypothetical protein R3C60_01860 [Parvularculaceae bacterium]